MRYKKPIDALSGVVQNTNRQVMNMQNFSPPTLRFNETSRIVLPRAPGVNEMAFFRNVADHDGAAVSPANDGPGLRGSHLSLVSDQPVTRRLPHVHETYD